MGALPLLFGDDIDDNDDDNAEEEHSPAVSWIFLRGILWRAHS